MFRICFAFLLAAVCVLHGIYGGDPCSEAGISINGMSCADYIAEDPCNCKRILFDKLVSAICCESCLTASTDDCCKDRLSAENSQSLSSGTVLTSCDQVRDNYQPLCRNDLLSGELGQCCETCAALGNCLNELVTFNHEYMCPEFIAMDHCHCTETINNKKVNEDCCHACKGLDTSHCNCRDKLSASRTLNYTKTERDGTKISIIFSDCDQVVTTDPRICNRVGGEGGSCCKSCEGECFNDPNFTLTFKKDGVKCRKCNCKEIRAFNKRKAKRFCKRNKKEMQTACCDMCSEFLP